MLAASTWATWAIAGIAVAGVIIRPLAWPEFIWAVAGAALLVVFGLLPVADAFRGVAKGTDVYLFLVGMMLQAELARQEGLFDWLAAKAAQLAAGSPSRLFTLIFAAGTLVTVFLSNDATAVVLTPAVAAATRAAGVAEALPYLLICAFIANAASFVLPISNPANLVIYASHMPPLLQWLPRYALPSLLSIVATYATLRWTQRSLLGQQFSKCVDVPHLPGAAKVAALGLAATALVLLASSTFDVQLGLPTFLAGVATAVPVLACARRNPLRVVREIAWGVLPLVAGLFVLVEALERSGMTKLLSAALQALVNRSPTLAAWMSGVGVGLVSNMVNNLPAGLLAGSVVETARVPEAVRSAVLIGVDLGPNLSVTGSLATILWLVVMRREGHHLGAWQFLRIGALVMPLALLFAIGTVVAFP